MKTKRIGMGLLIAGFVPLVFALALRWAEAGRERLFCVGTVFSSMLEGVVLIPCWILLWIAALLVFWMPRLNRVWSRVLLGIAAGLLALSVLCTALFAFAFRADIQSEEILSPDGNHTLVIHQRSFLISETVSVYERENLFFVHPLYTRDTPALRRLPKGFYDILWLDSGVWIVYDGNSYWYPYEPDAEGMES